jgi:Putative lumazine-binding
MTEKTAHGALLSAVSQYLEMMYDGDLGRFDAVFAPTAQLHGVQEGEVRVLPAAEYRRLLASRPSPQSKNAPRQQEILLIDIASSSQALVKVRVRIDDVLCVLLAFSNALDCTVAKDLHDPKQTMSHGVVRYHRCASLGVPARFSLSEQPLIDELSVGSRFPGRPNDDS